MSDENDVQFCLDPGTVDALKKSLNESVADGSPCSGGSRLVTLDLRRAGVLATVLGVALTNRENVAGFRPEIDSP